VAGFRLSREVMRRLRLRGLCVTTKIFVHWLTTPGIARIGRDIVGAFLVGQGVIRVIDGRVFNLLPLEYAPDWAYAIAQIILGAAILATGGCRWRHTVTGRVIASITAGFCVLLAVASLPNSAPSAWGALVLGWVCILEAGARECK
jgi:hypothetical protein